MMCTASHSLHVLCSKQQDLKQSKVVVIMFMKVNCVCVCTVMYGLAVW